MLGWGYCLGATNAQVGVRLLPRGLYRSRNDVIVILFF